MYRPLAALLAAATIVATPAFAASENFRMEIDYNAARLDAPQTVRAEYASIRHQVVERCEAEHAELNFGQTLAVRSCTRYTLGAAIRKIDHPALTAVHAASR